MDSMAELVGLSSIFWSTKLLDIFKSFNNTNTQHSIKVAFISYGTTQTVPEAIKAEWKDRLIVIQSPINRPFSYSQKRHPPSSLAKLRDEERSQLAETIKKLYCAKQNEIIELSSGVNSENLSPDKLFLNQDQELHSSFGQFEMYLNPPSTTTIEPMLAPFPSHPETGYSMQGS
ncbi:hypothetical protein N7481_009392 [Penicillium waksmanii]|uniref:uncharacterized protein n=1 Tax=Penicillium waksmanii TaxID=69791 RepID=UPI002546F939|nr:uncharacterized protein N7481_009392 [Penicillium waksmanii]KAJ5975685.1 hypothetical protein N7481_009392 [Penicillium waksmanii]